MEIVPFKTEHAQFILSQQLNANELYLRPEHRKYAMYLEELGLSFTALINDKPIAAGGIYVLWDGVAEGWVMATKDIWKHSVVMAKHFKKKTDVLIETTNIKMLFDKNINVCIGTDSPMSGGENLLTEIKFDKSYFHEKYDEEL